MRRSNDFYDVSDKDYVTLHGSNDGIIRRRFRHKGFATLQEAERFARHKEVIGIDTNDEMCIVKWVVTSFIDD